MTPGCPLDVAAVTLIVSGTLIVSCTARQVASLAQTKCLWFRSKDGLESVTMKPAIFESYYKVIFLVGEVIARHTPLSYLSQKCRKNNLFLYSKSCPADNELY